MSAGSEQKSKKASLIMRKKAAAEIIAVSNSSISRGVEENYRFYMLVIKHAGGAQYSMSYLAWYYAYALCIFTGAVQRGADRASASGHGEAWHEGVEEMARIKTAWAAERKPRDFSAAS